MRNGKMGWGSCGVPPPGVLTITGLAGETARSLHLQEIPNGKGMQASQKTKLLFQVALPYH